MINECQSNFVGVFSGPTNYRDYAPIEGLVRQSLGSISLPKDFVRPGDKIVLKPNWVKEFDERFPGPNRWEHVVTHPTIIEAVIYWVGEQLLGSGSITICDAPQTDSSFQSLSEYCALPQMLDRCRSRFPGLRIEILDLRPEEWHAVDGVTVSKKVLSGDPLGAVRIGLNEGSEFVDFSGLGRLYGASYDMAETNERHQERRHEYMLCRTPMEADVLINLPKLKTHKKVGVTCALKNLVGINANKNWLPHHTEGSPEEGGDQFPCATRKTRLEQSWMGTAKRWLKHQPALSRAFVPLKKIGRIYFGDTQKVVRSGNWHGNDTCWRMVLDLNKCLFFFDGAGNERSRPLRYLSVVDGIIAGEGNGPMSPDPKSCGIVIAGTHPVAVDLTAATLMGFDWDKIRLLKNSFSMRAPNFTPFTPGDVLTVSNNPAWSGRLKQMRDIFRFRPHFGWVGAIEKSRESQPTKTPALA